MLVFEGGGLVNSLINKLPFELHIPGGYQYCGSGTKLQKRLARGDPEINPLDAACKQHDIAYSQHSSLEERHKADKELENRAWERVKSKDASIGEKTAALLIVDNSVTYGSRQTSCSEEVFRSLGDLFFHSLNRFSERIFQYLADTNEKTTYADILIWSVRVATKLKERGITEHDIICSCSHNQKFSVIPFIATQFLGAVICNLDPKLSHIDTVHLLKLIQPKILFVAEESLDFIESCLKKANVTTNIVVFDDSTTAVIFCSSGTTGLPKGIRLSHRALIKSASTYISLDTNNPMAPSILLMYPTLYWISAAFSLIRVTLMGFASVICKDFDAAHTWKVIEKYKVS
uniref:4-coumarate--CoA ligase 1-like n=1 Tax=Diabrotica virgifera virgifera TaxID=50390 RepID=A0A6P7GUK9_DIAVI